MLCYMLCYMLQIPQVSQGERQSGLRTVERDERGALGLGVATGNSRPLSFSVSFCPLDNVHAAGIVLRQPLPLKGGYCRDSFSHPREGIAGTAYVKRHVTYMYYFFIYYLSRAWHYNYISLQRRRLRLARGPSVLVSYCI